MKRILAAILLALTVQAQADTGIDAVFVLSNDLGYEDSGFGLQLNHDGRQGAWGYDLRATALRHAKYNATGNRYQAIAMGRRFFGQWFIEAGAEYGGYKSEFPDGTTWTKYGYSPGVGIGMNQGGTEWMLQYFAPDSTPNETSMIIASGEIPLTGNWTVGASFEHWSFNETANGMHLMFKLGYRF